MKKTATILALTLIPFIASAESASKIDFTALKGKTREQLQESFKGTEATVKNWKNTGDLHLWFNANKKLNQISIAFPSPKSEKAAIKFINEEVGINTSKAKTIDTRAAIRLESVHSAIKTITLKKNFPKSDIEEVTITYAIRYNE